MFSKFGIWEITLLFSIVLYFIPLIIAIIRHAKNVVGIVLLNIFGGWTFIGWIVALIWAIVDKVRVEELSINKIDSGKTNYCIECGNRIDSEMIYCSQCGKKLR